VIKRGGPLSIAGAALLARAGKKIAGILPRGQVASVSMADDMRTANDFAAVFAGAIREFIECVIARQHC
jgi:hypothetical protein